MVIYVMAIQSCALFVPTTRTTDCEFNYTDDTEIKELIKRTSSGDMTEFDLYVSISSVYGDSISMVHGWLDSFGQIRFEKAEFINLCSLSVVNRFGAYQHSCTLKKTRTVSLVSDSLAIQQMRTYIMDGSLFKARGLTLCDEETGAELRGDGGSLDAYVKDPNEDNFFVILGPELQRKYRIYQSQFHSEFVAFAYNMLEMRESNSE